MRCATWLTAGLFVALAAGLPDAARTLAGDEDPARAAPRVTGRVWSKLGLPVGGAIVRAAQRWYELYGDRADWDSFAPARVREDGMFALESTTRLDSVRALDEIVVCVEAPGHAPALTQVISLRGAACLSNLEVAVDAGASLAGRVVGEQGDLVTGATLTLSPSPDGRRWPPGRPPGHGDIRRGSADGTFRFDRIVPGAYHLDVERIGCCPARARVSLPVPSPLDVRLEPARSISGTVCAHDGRPLAAALVWVTLRNGFRHATTDGAGAFRVDAVPVGTWRCSITASPTEAAHDVPRQTHAVEVATDGTDPRIVLPRARSIHGTLVEPDGSPGARRTISAWTEPNDGQASRTAMWRDDGTFVLRDVGPGPFWLRVEGTTAEFGPCAPDDTPILRLAGTATLRGRLVLPAAIEPDVAIQRVEIVATPVSPSPHLPSVRHRIVAFQSETFAIGDLAPGRYTLAFDGGASARGRRGEGFDLSFPAPVVAETGDAEAVLDVVATPRR